VNHQGAEARKHSLRRIVISKRLQMKYQMESMQYPVQNDNHFVHQRIMETSSVAVTAVDKLICLKCRRYHVRRQDVANLLSAVHLR